MLIVFLFLIYKFHNFYNEIEIHFRLVEYISFPM